MNEWEKFYALSLTLPAKEYTHRFLHHIPQGSNILDFGSGDGKWAAAFHRDRPDLTIDLIDRNTPTLITQPWKGDIFQENFAAFQPKGKYAGIWAHNVLFFLAQHEIAPTFHKLSHALLPNGIIEFSMIRECPDIPANFSGLSAEGLESMLKAEHLTALNITLAENVEYGNALVKRSLPTFYVQAQKLG